MSDFEVTGVDEAAGGSEAEAGGWEALAATLQRPEAGNGASQREDGSRMPEAAERAAALVDPGTLATLVGEEVASVLKAAQVAAAEIRSKAEDLAADAQRRIAEMQSALALMSAEMTDLMARTAERVPFASGPERTGGSARPVDEPIVIEHRSGAGTPTISEETGSPFMTDSTRHSDPDVEYRPGDYQRWLQRMGELSSQEPG